MQIVAAELFHIATRPNPERSPLRAESNLPGANDPRETVVVRLTDGTHFGWGEANVERGPWHRAEWAAGALACLRDWLAPAIVGHEVTDGAALQTLLAPVAGNYAAKAALDAAWWSLHAAAQGKALAEVIGGSATKDIIAARHLPEYSSLELFMAELQLYVDQGYRHFTLDISPEWNVRMLEAVRRQFPDLSLNAAAHECFTLDDFDLLCRFDDFQLAWIEQPLPADDLIDHARLQAALQTPLALSAGITSLYRLEQALDLGSCRAVGLDPSRLGGLTVAIDVMRRCHAAGIGCYAPAACATTMGLAVPHALASCRECESLVAVDDRTDNWFVDGAAGTAFGDYPPNDHSLEEIASLCIARATVATG